MIYECSHCKKTSESRISLVKNTGKMLNFCKGTCYKNFSISKGKYSKR